MVKDKDPNRPKRAMSAYFIFMQDYRNHCKMSGEANTSNVAEFTKLASVKWRAMNDVQKEPYDQRAVIGKQRYEAQMAAYVPTPGYSRTARRKKHPDAPKRPKSAYLHFLDAFRAKNRDNMGHKEIISNGAAAWAQQTDEDKKPFNSLYEVEKAKYNQLLQSLSSSGSAAAYY